MPRKPFVRSRKPCWTRAARRACLAVALAGLVFSREARAIDRDACAVPYQEAQVLRKKQIYSAALEQLDRCRASCPEVLVADCAAWTAELRALMPTAVFRVHDPDGRPRTEVRILSDGALLSESPGENPVAIDPGEHQLRIEGPGILPGEVRATFREGEHRRVIDVTVRDAMSKTVPPAPAAEAPSRVPAFVLGAVGLGGLALGGALGLVGEIQRIDLAGTCSPHCSLSSADAIRTEWWVGIASAGAGAAFLTAAILLWPRTSRAAPVVWMAPGSSGASLGISGRF